MTENDALTATKIDWASLSGVIIDGCELKDIADSRDNAVRFTVKILGSGGRMATGYFLHLEPKEAEDQLDVWLTLREIRHPNLSRPLSAGRRDVNGVDTIYMIMPDPDESLVGVIPERPLEWEEAASLLRSAEQALAHLHSHGLVHGSVSPETIGAVGYDIILNTDAVHRKGIKPYVEWHKPRYLAPESSGANVTFEADVWCLGETLFETLSQERYGTPGADLEKGLPLGAVVKRCLDKNPVTRCTLKESVAYEDAPPEPATPEPAPKLEAQTPPVVAEPAVGAPAQAPGTATPPPSTAKTPVIETVRPAPNTVRGRGGERPRAPVVPHPLTPKPAPRRVTKEDMALVPIAKRQRKVQGKRQPVGARIRTLDTPTQETAEESKSTSTLLSDGVFAVPAKILVLGAQKKSKLVRGAIFAVALAALAFLATWFVILPKLQGPVEPPPAVESAQTAPAGVGSPTDLTTANPAAAPVATPVAPLQSPLDPVLPERHKLELFYAVASSHPTQDQAVRQLNTFTEKYPDVVFKVVSIPRNGDVEAKLLVIVGGQLTRSEGEDLKKKLASKGLAVQLQRIGE